MLLKSEIAGMKDWYNRKKVFITGHTGFKGSWLSKMLISFGAEVSGYSLGPMPESLFSICKLDKYMDSVIGDIRDYNKLEKTINDKKPEIIIHLAAQPLVRDSYQNPKYTYETNVMGTVNICECTRKNDFIKSFLNVTTDKVYFNHEWNWGYRENDYLDGYDPYSNSKSCSELVTGSYKRAFFNGLGIAVSTARAGNVIGGGDFANDRILPDCYRAIKNNNKILIRNASSIRPYQHVLEALFAYLMISRFQYEDMKYADSYNVGPGDEDCITTGKLVELFCSFWGDTKGWECVNNSGPHEANFLKLDSSKMKAVFGWDSGWGIDKAVQSTVEWYKAYLGSDDVNAIMEKQINEYSKIMSRVN